MASQGSVGRLVECGQAEDRRVIRLVRDRPLLYARSTMPVASYYTHVKKLWQEVADEMGWSVSEVRRKWSHIRNSYSRHLRNELHGARTGRGRAVSRWYLADEMVFLREHMATDTRAAPLHYPPTLVDLDRPADEPPAASPWLAARPKPEPSEDSCGSQSFRPDENSSFFQFFRGVHPEYRALTARRRRQFKRRCLEVLHDLLDDQEEDPEPPPAAAPSLRDEPFAGLVVETLVEPGRAMDLSADVRVKPEPADHYSALPGAL